MSYPVEREVTDYSDFTGRTEAVELVEVRARVDGFLKAIHFKEGTIVDEGELLYVIDQRPFQAELDRATALFEQAQAAVTESRARLAEAEAQVPKAEAGLTYSERRYKRSQEVFARNAIPEDELELHRSEMVQAQANLEAVKAQLGSAQAAIATAEAAEASAAAAVAIAELNLEYTRVTAPISGRISRTRITEGNLVQSAAQGESSLLTTIVSIDPMYVYFDVDEPTVLRVRELIRQGKAKSARDPGVKLPVFLALDDNKGFVHQGTIDFVDNQVNPQTGTLRVRGVFQNDKELLSPGLFARLRVPIGQPRQALLVTERALDSDQGQKILYVVVENDEVAARAVETGALHNGLREIKQGLNASDRVVVLGLQHVRPGIVVEPNVVDMPGQSAAPAAENESAQAALSSRPRSR